MPKRLRELDPKRIWDVLLILAFVPGAATYLFYVLIMPSGMGVHANIYARAAGAWLAGGDPWLIGPELAVFAGPPTMLLPFVPFAALPDPVNTAIWVIADLAIAVWVLRRLGMPAYWLAFPPLFFAIILGHIEVLVLAAMVVRTPLAGLAAAIKPYAAIPMLAERRWSALAVAAIAVAVTFPFLPWPRFFQDLPLIAANLARQDTGDSVFGQPLLMLAGAAALLSLGPKRALWLAVPVLWPHAQGMYKTMTIPALTPVVALFWALPFQGATVLGVIAYAVLVQVGRVRKLPGWLRAGIEPVARSTAAEPTSEPVPSARLVIA